MTHAKLLFFCFLGCWHLLLAQEMSLKLSSFLNLVQGEASHFQKIQAATKLAQSENAYPELLDCLNYPDARVRLWVLEALANYRRETWQATKIQEVPTHSSEMTFLSEGGRSYYLFPKFSSVLPQKIAFQTKSSTFEGVIKIGNEEFIFCYDPKQYQFYRKGEKATSYPWTPYFPPDFELMGEIGFYQNMVFFFLFYKKDIYPKKSVSQKNMINCYEEILLPCRVLPNQEIMVQLPGKIATEKVSAFYDPHLEKFLARLSDPNQEVRFKTLDLLVNATKSGGRDYCRRLLESGFLELKLFLRRENLEDTLWQLYREKIIASLNRESMEGAGNYDGQFADITLMGRQLAVEILWEILSKHNEDLENLGVRILSCQALQELQYAPKWLYRKLNQLRQQIERLADQPAFPDDNVKQLIRQDSLRNLGSVVASVLYMLGDDAYFTSEEGRLIRKIQNDPWGNPLYAELELAYFYLRFRMYDKALEQYHRIIKGNQYAKNRLGIAYYNMACAYAMKRMKKEALEAFKICIEECEYTNLEWLLKDRDLDFIRNEPEFIRLVEYLQEQNSR